MPGGEVTKQKLRCPECEANVRSDRLEAHLSSVHPGVPMPKELKSRLSGVARKAKAGKKSRAGGFWTRGRIVGVTVGVVVLVIVVYAFVRSPGTPQAQNGSPAPDFTFTDLSGTSHSLSSYQGHPVVLWWVATFCSGCSQGTVVFAQSYYSQYRSAGVTLIEVESYNNLGQSGPSLSSFASQNGYSNQAGWVMGYGSSAGMNAYNPNGYLDVYYVISSQGSIVSSGQGLGGSFGTALSQAESS